MKIVFFGTSDFAIPALRKLADSEHSILLLVTQPDRRRGRRLLLSPPPTKVLAAANGIPVYQVQDASSRESIDRLKKLGADLFVVISFGQILKKDVLSIPRHYAINVHGSLLPEYRGAAPTNWCIINGDKTSGITLIRMNERMDEGDIILKKEVAVCDEDTNITISEKLSALGAEALIETLGRLEKGEKLSFEKQDPSKATYAPKLKKEDGLINWKDGAEKINNMVRGLLPWPGAYTFYEKRILKILKAEVIGPSSGSGLCGGVIDAIKDRGLVVRTGRGDLAIKYLQLEGKKILDADSFLRGHRIEKGHVFG